MKTTKVIVRITRNTKRTRIVREGKRFWVTKRKTITNRLTIPRTQIRETDGGKKVLRTMRRTVIRNAAGNKLTKIHRTKTIVVKESK